MMRLTVAQALVRFLAVQEVERDGARARFFAGCFGIFGHGNVAGLGQALHQYRELLPFHPARNEQAMVHLAAGYARQRNRLGAFACTTSVGPGATNMVTGAALATINRVPVLLLPGDTFATRTPHPVLQQLEVPHDATMSVNDTLRPVSRFFERVQRAEQLIPAALEAMRVLTDPAETGAVTLARAAELIRDARRPLIVAGGGVIYSEATAALRELVDAVGIPVCETQAGRGALVSEHPLSLGAVGATGTAAANRLAREADLVIGVGTRWSDFTTSSKSAFQDPEVRFVNVNVTGFDAAKHSGLPVIADAQIVLERLRVALDGHRVDPAWERRAADESSAWAAEVDRLVSVLPGGGSPPSQAAIIASINDAAGETGVVVCAAGSAPGDLHKLWRARDAAGKSYHVEYGYSCMGYEIPGGIGVKLAAPERDVYVLVGDGSYLMLPGELATAVAERVPIVVVLVDNHGYASIGALSRSLGSAGFGTHHRWPCNGTLPLDAADGAALADPGASEALPLDLAANAESLGVRGQIVIHIEADRYAEVPGYESWWDVPVAEVSEEAEVRAAREGYERARRTQRIHLDAP